MARAIWAARAQLLARLRPHVSSGLAPLELLPEVCGHLRGLGPSEICTVLEAYNGHGDSDSLLLGAGRGGEKAPVHLLDLLVQLLARSSHISEGRQLLEMGRTMSSCASCESKSALDFWAKFTHRLGRMSAQNSLDGPQLAMALEVSGPTPTPQSQSVGKKCPLC